MGNNGNDNNDRDNKKEKKKMLIRQIPLASSVKHIATCPITNRMIVCV